LGLRVSRSRIVGTNVPSKVLHMHCVAHRLRTHPLYIPFIGADIVAVVDQLTATDLIPQRSAVGLECEHESCPLSQTPRLSVDFYFGCDHGLILEAGDAAAQLSDLRLEVWTNLLVCGDGLTPPDLSNLLLLSEDKSYRRGFCHIVCCNQNH
jgi:hypothetical protein